MAPPLELAALGSTARRVVLDVASAPVLAPAPNGKVYLLYLRDTSLMGQEFDETAGTLRGTPFLLVDQIGIVATPPLQPAVGVSPRGVLAYQNTTEIGAGDARLTWFDRSGKALSPLPSAASGLAPRLSPDGRFAAVHRTTAAGNNIWVLDLSRGSAIRLTSAKGGKSYGSAVWSPDGKRVAYHLLGGGMYVKEPGGNGAEKELVKTATPAVPQSWSADGRQILFWHEDRLYLCQVDGGQAPITIGPASAVWATGARISPDGKFFAFASTGTGRAEVYVEEMPPGTKKSMVSIDGGMQPKWRQDGKELFFLSPEGKLMAADMHTGEGIQAGVPHELFQTDLSTPTSSQFDASPDGQRFLIGAPNFITADAPITVVLNWWAGIRKQ